MRGVRTTEMPLAEVLRLHEEGRGIREIGRLCGVPRSTISDLLADEKKKRESARRRSRYQARLVPVRQNESFRLSADNLEEITKALPDEAPPRVAGFLDEVEERARRNYGQGPRLEQTVLDEFVYSLVDFYFGEAKDREALRNAKAEIAEIVRRAKGKKARNLELGEMQTASECRAVREAPPRPSEEIVAAAKALRSGERDPLVKQRIEARVRALAGGESSSALARNSVWQEHADGALKRAYRQWRLMPVTTARNDLTVRAELERLGIRLN